MNKPKLEVIIPSINGLFLLKKHLPEAIAFSGKDTAITVVDDDSVDGTLDYLAANFPKVKCLRQDQNLGFTKSVNHGFGESSADLVILLNNDVSPKKNYLASALKHFDHDRTFAVTLDETTSSWPLVSWDGKLQYIRGEDKTAPRFSAWASGGSAIFRKSIWDELGGFDEIYSPGYWEDIDIGWRAWKAGYQIIWEPKALVEHQHESSFSKLDQNFVSLVKQRNELIFNWKNISDPDLRHDHFLYLLRHTLIHPGYLKVVFAALKAYPQVKKTKGIITDREVLALVNQPLA